MWWKVWGNEETECVIVTAATGDEAIRRARKYDKRFEKLYGLFEEVFGEDSAEGMPDTADAIESYFLSELRHCGKQVDASKVADIMSAIYSMWNAEERFHAADKATPDFLDAWCECCED